jgi:uncharacterized protein DUF6610
VTKKRSPLAKQAKLEIAPTMVERSITDYLPDDHNANAGTERGLQMIEDSLHEEGVGRSIVADKNRKIPAGNKTLEAAVNAGITKVLEVTTGGDTLLVHRREDWDLDDPTGAARRYAFRDNRASEVGLAWDVNEIARSVSAGVDFAGIYTENELAALLKTFQIPKTTRTNPRKLPLDMIYTLQMADCTCCLAVQAGLKYGINSAHYRICPYEHELTGRHEVCFIDNDYFHYQHDIHLAAVAKFKPKYATVCDLMSEQQCKEDGLAYHPFEEIMDWAEALREHAENVILIPKYDCLDRIPDHFMLGYSIPTSHGGTPLHPERFKGRRLHLLGGSWSKQLDYLDYFGDDVRSVDNNHVAKVASEWGQFVNAEGQAVSLTEAGFGMLNNPRYVALAISFGAIGAKVNELYAIHRTG